ncbi:MAG: hypothetical protein LC799_07675 [Actinobacteria bacterium]|nr:hypothetical protein [Actinomycetota bacterium]
MARPEQYSTYCPQGQIATMASSGLAMLITSKTWVPGRPEPVTLRRSALELHGLSTLVQAELVALGNT